MCWKKVWSKICYKFGWYRPMIYVDASIVESSILKELGISKEFFGHTHQPEHQTGKKIMAKSICEGNTK